MAGNNEHNTDKERGITNEKEKISKTGNIGKES
jgi:hypothetical protein